MGGKKRKFLLVREILIEAKMKRFELNWVIRVEGPQKQGKRGGGMSGKEFEQCKRRSPRTRRFFEESERIGKDFSFRVQMECMFVLMERGVGEMEVGEG